MNSGRYPSRRGLGGILAALVLMIAACGSTNSTTSSTEVIKIGAVQPISGPFATLGKEAVDGMKMATDLVNSEGGVNGKQVKLVVADTPSVQDVQSQIERLVKTEGVHVVAGTYGSSLAIEAATTTTRFGGFYFEVSSASSDITSKSAPYSLKVPWTIPDLVNITPAYIANLLAPQLGKDAKSLRVALLHEDTAYGGGVAQLLPAGLSKAGLQPLVQVDPYTAASVQDFTPIINRLKDAHVDILLAASYLDDTQLFLKQAGQQGLKIPAVVGLTAGYADAGLPSRLPGNVLNGVYVLDSDVLLKKGLNKDGLRLRDEMLKRYAKIGSGTPVSHTAYAFLGTYALLHYILQGVDPNNRDAVLKKGESVDVPEGSLPMGFGLKFAPTSDLQHPHINTRTVVLLNQWQNGQIVAVGPSKFAEAKPIAWEPSR